MWRGLCPCCLHNIVVVTNLRHGWGWWREGVGKSSWTSVVLPSLLLHVHPVSSLTVLLFWRVHHPERLCVRVWVYMCVCDGVSVCVCEGGTVFTRVCSPKGALIIHATPPIITYTAVLSPIMLQKWPVFLCCNSKLICLCCLLALPIFLDSAQWLTKIINWKHRMHVQLCKSKAVKHNKLIQYTAIIASGVGCYCTVTVWVLTSCATYKYCLPSHILATTWSTWL